MANQRLNSVLKHWYEFYRSQSFAGVLLLACTVVALMWANSNWSASYHYLQHVHFALHLGNWGLNMQLETWVNDGLMAIFFLLVGLEIKRELLVGELSAVKTALLPITAAIGGMLVPALIFYSFNHARPEFQAGWGIPMATDIAFALGILSLLTARFSRSLFVLLAAIAIVDDLGAVLVIALFYTNTLHWSYLLAALIICILLITLNLAKVKKLMPYLLLGFILWYCLLNSGVHATIAGVLLAITLPCRLPVSPLQRLEHNLHKPVNFVIVPIFVLFNAGISITISHLHTAAFSPLAYGIIAGLIIGKIIGLFGSSWLLIKLKWIALPDTISFKQLFGMSILGGIGFTMAIFITTLAFPNDQYAINIAKIAIFSASIIAAVTGYVYLRLISLK